MYSNALLPKLVKVVAMTRIHGVGTGIAISCGLTANSRILKFDGLKKIALDLRLTLARIRRFYQEMAKLYMSKSSVRTSILFLLVLQPKQGR